MLSTYPIKRPIHGGQRRSNAIASAINKTKWSLVTSAIFNPAGYKNNSERAKADFPITGAVIKKIKAQPILEDIIIGKACYSDPSVKQHLFNLITKYKPTYILLEQPYLYIGLQMLLTEFTNPPKIIYSSQNIEHTMKQDIYKQHSYLINDRLAKQTVALIKQTEERLCRTAEYVFAVSKNDAKQLEKMGSKDVIIVPNGIEAKIPTTKRTQKWNNYFTKNSISNPILFTGSAHPPNWTGFLKMIGGRLGFIPINSKLIIVGDIGDALEYVLKQNDPEYSSTFWLRAKNCKRLSDDDLAALLAICNTIVLPITEGGGSNLKTAEAIFSRKNIVATSFAMRGYEEFATYPNIYIEDNPVKFKEKIISLLDSKPKTLSNQQIETTKTVLWKNRTKQITELFEGIYE